MAEIHGFVSTIMLIEFRKTMESVGLSGRMRCGANPDQLMNNDMRIRSRVGCQVLHKLSGWVFF